VGSIEESLEYYNKAAEANFNKKNYDESFEIYRKIADLDSLSIISRQKMIQSALKLNSREKAVESYFSLYECLEKKDAHAEAKKILDKIEKIDPGSTLLEKVRGKKRKVKAEKEKVGESIDFDSLFKEEVSEEILLKEEPEEKVVTLDSLLDITDYAAHFNLGITYKEMGLIEEAIDEFKKAMKEKSWRLKSLEMLGLCHELLDQNEKAEDIYKIVINTDNFREDEKIAFFYHLGNLFARKGDYEDALKNYKKATQIDREFADLNKRIELINRKIAGEEVEEEISFTFGEMLLEEGAELWDVVVGGGKKEKETVKSASKKSGKISYI
jgi:tetratricopeptide (TPR) repeat protein